MDTAATEHKITDSTQESTLFVSHLDYAVTRKELEDLFATVSSFYFGTPKILLPSITVWHRESCASRHEQDWIIKGIRLH